MSRGKVFILLGVGVFAVYLVQKMLTSQRATTYGPAPSSGVVNLVGLSIGKPPQT